MMTVELARPKQSRWRTAFARRAWVVLLMLSAIVGLFGVSDMVMGTADLQNGETVLMHSLTGASWTELKAGCPGAANLIEWKMATGGATLAGMAIMSMSICLTGFRQGQRWAWYAMWALPIWLALMVLFTLGAVRYSGFGTPIPAISGTLFLVLCSATLGLSYRSFARGSG
jgi:hypothetical protein